MQLARLKFKMIHRTSNTIIYNGYWDIPQCELTEYEAIRAAFVEYTGVSASTDVNLCDNFAGPTDIYDWIDRNTSYFYTTLPYCCSPAEYVPPTAENPVVRAFDSWFPMADVRDNFANRLFSLTPDSTTGSNHYAWWDIDIVTDDATYSTKIGTYKRDSGGSGYYAGLQFDNADADIQTNDRGCPQLTYRYTNTGNTGYCVFPIRITEDGVVTQRVYASIKLVDGAYPFKISANDLFPTNYRAIDNTKPVQAFLYEGGDIFDPRTPYNQFPINQPSGGDGEDDDRDDMDFADTPALGAVDSGFITLFLPSKQDINDLADYMWSTNFDVDQVKKLLLSPMDAIIGLYILPFTPTATGYKALKVAGMPISNWSWLYTTDQFVSINCGSIDVPPASGSYLDYAPMTKLQIWLPYIGFRDISADDVMGRTIALRYNVDVLTGSCVAELKCGGTVLYSWSGQCSAQIPVTGADLRNAISSAISIAATAASIVAGGPTAAAALAGVASVGQNTLNGKPVIQRGGSVSGAAGFMAQQTPYIVRSNPIMARADDQQNLMGYPSYVTANLAELVGYNEIDIFHLEGIPATVGELEELETILRTGAIF